MSYFARYWHSHRVLTSILVALVLARALIPAGYMPSSERPFTLQMCPGTFPAHLLPAPAAPVHGDGTDAGHDPGDATAHRHHLHHAHDAATPVTGVDHAQHGSRHSFSAENCVFGTAPAAGPALQLATFAVAVSVESTAQPEPTAAIRLKSRRFSLQQPRAPPILS